MTETDKDRVLGFLTKHDLSVQEKSPDTLTAYSGKEGQDVTCDFTFTADGSLEAVQSLTGLAQLLVDRQLAEHQPAA